MGRWLSSLGASAAKRAFNPILCLAVAACGADSAGMVGAAQDAGESQLDASRYQQRPPLTIADAGSEDAGPLGDAGGPFDGGVDAGSGMDAGPELDATIGPDAAARTDASADAGWDWSRDAGGDYPALLSETGLFLSVAHDTFQLGVSSFAPRYTLWSDGASKRRWLALPPGTRIDTSDMDAWRFPVGTKAWKEFTVQGVRVETRLLHKLDEGHWVMIAYRWRSDQSDADALPQGQTDALGTPHDIPDQTLCVRCHGNTPDALLGVSAIQLSHDQPGINLMQLAKDDLLTHAPAANFLIPGGTVAEQALGYLHANCGHCHHPGSPVYQEIMLRTPHTGGPVLWERTDALATLAQTVGYASTVDRPNSILPDLHIIEPGYPARSELFIRIGQRGPGSLQMPPIATEIVDDAGMARIQAFIESLAP